ncbi:sporulation related protein [Paracoccus pantotrophus]|uniref:SPOR domain-containing protein n=1 Tax=Paracoccus pantotrophus TaxID=82367 RepID=A0AAE6TTS9_PARPN|nr:SPOR domain-containing protein [Paracoccus pantotrophus]QFG37096.1 SPOR domain-containing protein [Paracoccus pantotrophus]RKS52485.1 sporulation related protein [Paracoccus pantotrophus]
MRVVLWLMLALLPGLALAQAPRPAEEPPADFTSRQYIDSRGCVFLRDELGGWAARLARDGTPICGYPPTLSARGAQGEPKLRALAPAAGRGRAELLEEALSQQVITNLRPGELASDPRPMERLPDLGPEPHPPAPADALRAALTAAPALRQGMGAALHPNRRLCELLGYDGGPGAAGLDDPTQGYCGGLPKSELSRLSFMRPVGSAAGAGMIAPPDRETAVPPPPAAVRPAPPPAARPAPEKPLPAGSASASAPTAKASAPARGKAPAAAPAAPSSAGMIPAGARYVQVGTFADPGNAERAAARIAQMGYPLLRGRDQAGGREVQFLVAGPFPDRESIVRALDAIRKAGFRDAFPR